MAASRVVSAISRQAGHAGTSLPGLLAERMAPGIAARIAADLDPVLLVSGTNGKTTTSHLLVHILERGGWRVVANRSGANLYQGLATTLVAAAALTGRLGPDDAAGVFEVDEVALSSMAGAVSVSGLILTNLFRDQLDRFGETEAIIRKWEGLLAGLADTAVVVSSADDPRVANLVSRRSGPAIEFGLSEPPSRLPDVSLTPDVSKCPRCDASLSYRWTSVGHLGDFDCQTCGLGRREPALGVRVLSSRGIDGQTLAFRHPTAQAELTVSFQLPGTSNAYNAAAAVAGATSLGIGIEFAVDALADATPAFGRYELVEMDGRRVVLTLGKNPASLAELARIAIQSDAAGVLFVLNDDFADGQDVSWYWDVDVAPLLEGRLSVIAGARALDFLLRLKYGQDGAGELPRSIASPSEPPITALDLLVSTASRGDTIFVMATYTALLGLRRDLVARGLLQQHPR